MIFITYQVFNSSQPKTKSSIFFHFTLFSHTSMCMLPYTERDTEHKWVNFSCLTSLNLNVENVNTNKIESFFQLDNFEGNFIRLCWAEMIMKRLCRFEFRYQSDLSCFYNSFKENLNSHRFFVSLSTALDAHIPSCLRAVRIFINYQSIFLRFYGPPCFIT